MTKKELNKMTKQEIIDGVKMLGVSEEMIKAMEASTKKELVDFFYNKMKEKEAKTEASKGQKQAKTEATKIDREAEWGQHTEAVLEAMTAGLPDGAELATYPNLADWVKVKLQGQTICEVHIGRKAIRVQANETVASKLGLQYKATNFAPYHGARIELAYDSVNQLTAIVKASDYVLQAKAEAK